MSGTKIGWESVSFKYKRIRKYHSDAIHSAIGLIRLNAPFGPLPVMKSFESVTISKIDQDFPDVSSAIPRSPHQTLVITRPDPTKPKIGNVAYGNEHCSYNG